MSVRCAYRWPDQSRTHTDWHHWCDRPADHHRDMLLRQPPTCRCWCGASTTRERTDRDA